jgi:hypothetical protein
MWEMGSSGLSIYSALTSGLILRDLCNTGSEAGRTNTSYAVTPACGYYLHLSCRPVFMLKDRDRTIYSSRFYRCQVLGRMTGVGNGAEGSISVTYCGKSRRAGLHNTRRVLPTLRKFFVIGQVTVVAMIIVCERLSRRTLNAIRRYFSFRLQFIRDQI